MGFFASRQNSRSVYVHDDGKVYTDESMSVFLGKDLDEVYDMANVIDSLIITRLPDKNGQIIYDKPEPKPRFKDTGKVVIGKRSKFRMMRKGIAEVK